MCCSNPHQGVLSTTVTTSHVTQGRVEYKSTIPQGTDKGLDLWEALPVVRISPVRVMSLEPVKSSGRNATLASGLACFGMAFPPFLTKQ